MGMFKFAAVLLCGAAILIPMHEAFDYTPEIPAKQADTVQRMISENTQGYVRYAESGYEELPASAKPADTDISAKSAILIDADSGRILYEKNADEKLPMASTTKIMSAMLTLESGNLDEYFTVDANAIKVEGSSMGLQEGDQVTKRVLCYGMLLPSGNDAANAAAVKIAGSVPAFVEMMNARAKEMGLNSTHFVTPSGLDDDTDEHYSTAYDMARLAAAAIQNPEFQKICSSASACISYGNPPYERWLTNSNKLLRSYQGIIGVKTGFTDKARRCLVSACQRNGVTLIAVTLNAPSDWQDHEKLYDYGFSAVNHYLLEDPYGILEVSVAGGEQDTVRAELAEEPRATLVVGEQDHVRQEALIPQFVYAPITAGDTLGYVNYFVGDKLVCSVPVCATEDVDAAPVEKMNIFEYYYHAIKRVFD